MLRQVLGGTGALLPRALLLLHPAATLSKRPAPHTPLDTTHGRPAGVPLLPAPPPPAALLARQLTAAKAALRVTSLLASKMAATAAVRGPLAQRNLTCANGLPLAPCGLRGAGDGCYSMEPSCNGFGEVCSCGASILQHMRMRAWRWLSGVCACGRHRRISSARMHRRRAASMYGPGRQRLRLAPRTPLAAP